MSTDLFPRTRNVTRVFRQASEEDLAAGRDWYARASRLAGHLSVKLPRSHPHYGDIDRAAAVIAVLSPRLSWPLNVRLAREAYSLAFVHSAAWEYPVNLRGALPANARKAAALLTTDAPTDDIVRGPKVRAFWRTIADPTDPRSVVVDRHAVDVAVGRVTNDAIRGRLLGRKGGIDSVALAYSRAARILSAEIGETITPAEVQAVTWTTWRRTRAAAFHNETTEV